MQGFEHWLGLGEVLDSFIWKNCLLSTSYECTVSIWEGNPGRACAKGRLGAGGHAKHGFLFPEVEGTEVNRTGTSARAMSARCWSRSPCFCFLKGVLEADQ